MVPFTELTCGKTRNLIHFYRNLDRMQLLRIVYEEGEVSTKRRSKKQNNIYYIDHNNINYHFTRMNNKSDQGLSKNEWCTTMMKLME